jgi:bifunctional DNase/RNase
VDSRVREIDARPSDALTLALRVKAPIFVAPEVMEQAGEFLLTTEKVSSGLEALHRKAVEEKRIPPEEVELEYRSFRSLPRGDVGGLLKPAESQRHRR